MSERLLDVDSLAYHRKGQELLWGVSFALHKGERYGLIGANGVGKTTLLKLLSGDLSPSNGKVLKQPGVSLYVGQQSFAAETLWQAALHSLDELNALEWALREEEQRLATAGGDLGKYAQLLSLFEAKGGYQAEQLLKKHLSEFGFDETRFAQSVSSLSGGEQMRLLLAMALSRQADILILDEPSNHLDMAMKRYVQKKLQGYPGAVILASHDRALLDAVATHIIELEQATLKRYTGNYSAYKIQKAQEAKRRNRQLKVKERLEQELEASFSAPSYQHAEKRRKKLLAGLEKLEPVEASQERSAVLAFSERKAKGLIYQAKALSKRFPELSLELKALQLYAGDKIALIGANGSGKSTLLKLIAGELESDDPRVEIFWHKDSKLFYFDQYHKGLNAEQGILEQLEYLLSSERAKMLLALVKLGQEYWYSYPEALSSGQKARAGLAKLVASEANVLLLDEPTNALDVAMIEVLEQSLKASTASILMASHDEALIRAVSKQVWSLEAGELSYYRGGLAGYFKGNKVPEAQNFLEELTSPSQEESYEEKRERLELERLSLEESLLDPFLLSERERQRCKLRYHEVWDELSVLYDEVFPEPLPRYQLQSDGLGLSSQGFIGTSCLLESAYGIGVKVQKLAEKPIGHVSFVKPQGQVLLAWAKNALLKATLELAFERLELRALQIQEEADLLALGFQQLENNWWVQDRSSYEQRQGFVNAKHKTSYRSSWRKAAKAKR